MPHPTELLRKILVMVERDYPPSRYRYAIEKFLPGSPRVAPDIAVFGPKNEALCVVEIGYTRPEKLTAYRHSRKIADVRWYDKTGLLHGDVQEKTVRLTVAFDTDMEVTVYNPFNLVPCFASDCYSDPPDDCEDFDEEMENALDGAQDSVESVIITDDARAWIFNFCDKCGGSWLSSQESQDDDGVADILSELREGDGVSHAKEWGKRERMSWSRIKQMMKESFDFDLVYGDGFWLFPEAERQFNRNVIRLSK